jgi:hypothetical protein
MAFGDPNAIVRKFVAADAGVTALVGARIYVPRIPEKSTYPAIGMFIRGGFSTPYIPEVIEPSFQFDCWAKNLDDPSAGQIAARAVYSALYECLQGAQDETVTIGVNTFRLLGAVEEGQGQDIQGPENTGYYRVLAFFRVMLDITI